MCIFVANIYKDNTSPMQNQNTETKSTLKSKDLAYHGNTIPTPVWNLLLKEAKVYEVVKDEIVNFTSKVINYEINFAVVYEQGYDLIIEDYGYHILNKGKKEWVQCVPTIKQIKDMKAMIKAKEVELVNAEILEEEEKEEARLRNIDPYAYYGVKRSDFIQL